MLNFKMREMKISAVFILFLILNQGPPAWGQDVQVSATVDRDTIGIHDQVQLSIMISGKDSSDAESPSLPDLQDFSVVSGPSIGNRFEWINGRSRSSKSFTYILVPKKEGQFTIGPVDVRVGDKIYKTGEIQVHVTSSPAATQPGSRSPITPLDPFANDRMSPRSPVGDAVFMKAELDRDSAYIGQQVTLLHKIYAAATIRGIELRENPKLSGFWVENLKTEKDPKGISQMIEGREYYVYTIKKQALFPTATGILKIPGSTFAISVDNGRDIFSIFDQSETIYRSTQELTLEVKPLPTKGKPADFNSVVGKFEISAEPNKREVKTGEAVELEVQLKGRGNIKTLPDIQLPVLSDFTTFSSKSEDRIEVLGNNQIGGEKTWKYVLVPNAAGQQKIPSISFTYFDADQAKYETVTTPPVALNVTGSGKGAVPPSGIFEINKQALTRQGSDINFIKLSAGNFGEKSSPFYRKAGFYLVIAFPVFLNMFALLYSRKQSRMNDNIAENRKRKARQNALKLLKNAEREGKPDARRYYDQAEAALSGYLADRFSLSGIELTGDKLEKTLSMKTVPRELIEETGSCLEECNFGRFVSAAADQGKMDELGERIRRTINELEKVTTDIRS